MKVVIYARYSADGKNSKTDVADTEATTTELSKVHQLEKGGNRI